MSAPTEKKVSKRTGNRAWKGIYGVDRKYTARVDRAKERAIFAPDAVEVLVADDVTAVLVHPYGINPDGRLNVRPVKR